MTIGYMPSDKPKEHRPREWWIRYPHPDRISECVPEAWPDSKTHPNIFENDEWIKVREILEDR